MNEPNSRPTLAQWLLLHVLPAAVIGIAGVAGILWLALWLRRPPEPKEPIRVVPAVEVVVASPSDIAIVVASQGTVQPRTQTLLVAEVSGRVESVSPALYAGGFFRRGDVLARIEDTEYKANLAAARSRLAEAKLAFAQEQAAAAQALEDWEAMGGDGDPGALALRQPQLDRAQASIEAAEAAVAIAERDLARTAIKAPYDGRVREKMVDLGQLVTARSSQIASIYAVDVAEIRLPLALDDLRYLDVPESYRDNDVNAGPKPAVSVEAEYGGQVHAWEGIIDRSEGAVDPQTRLAYVVAQVKDPYRQSDDPERPPLKIGTFVTARIQGKVASAAFRLPRRALQSDDALYLIDDDNRLRIQPVEIHQREPGWIVVTDGLAAGDRVCVTPLQYAVDGMEVSLDTPVQSAAPTSALEL